MAEKPTNIVYGLEEKPPLGSLILLALQHISVFFIGLSFPLLIIHLLGDSITAEEARNLISMTMVAGGVTTILQALRKGNIGSGYLLPSVSGPSYLAASIQSLTLGGLPLMFGMTAFVGILEMLFSRVMKKLRFLFPVEVTGVVVMMVGIVVIPMAVKSFFGIQEGHTELRIEYMLTGVITLAVMIILNVYAGGKIKLFSALIGMVIGYIAAAIFGVLQVAHLERVIENDFLSLPDFSFVGYAFEPVLIIPFTVAALCSSLKTVGDLVTCQKINDTGWKRPDMQSVSRGILVDGVGGLLPGLIGGFGQSTSSSNVGLSIATGATSRYVAFFAGGIYIALAFLPMLSDIFILMPAPVVGALLIFAVSFMIIAGFQLLTSRMLDGRKIFVIGISIIFGLSADMVPEIYKQFHPWLQPVFSSSLSLATVSAVLLNILFRIGISKKKSIEIEPESYSSLQIRSFMEKQGRTWGARPEVIYRAESVINEFIESAIQSEFSESSFDVHVLFDELKLEIDIYYMGKPVVLNRKKPSAEMLMQNDDAAVMLAGYLMQKNADKITIEEIHGKQHIHIYFEH